MKKYVVYPQVAGHIGERSIENHKVYPPIVEELEYVFDIWLGEALVGAYPVSLISREAMTAFVDIGITGADYEDIDLQVSEQFVFFEEHDRVPDFVWLKPTGKAEADDVSATPNSRLILSERALDILRGLGLNHAKLTPLSEWVLPEQVRAALSKAPD